MPLARSTELRVARLRNMIEIISYNHPSTRHSPTSNENNDKKNCCQQLDRFLRYYDLLEGRLSLHSVIILVQVFQLLGYASWIAINGAVSYEAEMNLGDDRRLRCYVNSDQTVHPDKIADSTIDVESEVTFHLFTNSNKKTAHLLRVEDLPSLTESNFDPESPTKIVVHGWTDCVNTHWYSSYRYNYLNTGNYNVILVDWSSGASREYFTSSKLTRAVGEHLGNLLTVLEENANASLSTFHILGHSLGAHIAGIAGNTVSGRVGRVTGMDPASPGFEVPFLVLPKYRLDPTDAQFVDVVHTCSGTLGFTMPIGHADFYPNGGTFTQPGCPPITSQSCSHARAHQLVSESIIRPKGFLALRCDSWREFLSGRCGQDDDKAFMGEMVSHETRGIFYLRTNPRQPFGRSN